MRTSSNHVAKQIHFKCNGRESWPLYYSYYILSIDDLKHLTAVRSVQHNKFAEENGLASFMMSAKNGDQVNQAFWKIASNLAGKLILSSVMCICIL